MVKTRTKRDMRGKKKDASVTPVGSAKVKALPLKPVSVAASQLPSSIKSVRKEQKVYCLFCYKSCANYQDNLDGDNDKDKTEGESERIQICDTFFNQLSSSSPSSFSGPGLGEGPSSNLSDGGEENKENEDNISFWSDQLKRRENGSLLEDGGNIYGACNDCFYVIKMYCELFKEIEDLQANLKQKLESLYNVMRFAGKVSSRVKEFKDSFLPPLPPKPINSRKKRKVQEDLKTATQQQQKMDSVLKLRRKIFRTCGTRLNIIKKAPPKPDPKNSPPQEPEPASTKGTLSTAAAPDKDKTDNQDDDDEVEILAVIKSEPKEPELVQLDMDPSLLSHAGEGLDDDSYPWEGASWMNGMPGTSATDAAPEPEVYQCIKCNDMFNSEQDLIQHATTSHVFTEEDANFKDAELFHCKFCDFSTRLVETLVEHEMKGHRNATEGATSTPVRTTNRVMCARCPEMISSRTFDQCRHYVKRHLGIPLPQTLFQKNCGTCGKVYRAFTAAQANLKLAMHMRLVGHSAAGVDNPANDKTPGQLEPKMVQEDDGDKKRKRRVGLKNVPCPLCGKLFGSQWQVKVHQITHTGERPFGCHHCDLKYTTKYNLTKHLKRIHKEEYNPQSIQTSFQFEQSHC